MQGGKHGVISRIYGGFVHNKNLKTMVFAFEDSCYIIELYVICMYVCMYMYGCINVYAFLIIYI